MHRTHTATGSAGAARAHRQAAWRMQELVSERSESRMPTASLDGWKPANERDAAQYLRWALSSGHDDIVDAARAWVRWYATIADALKQLCVRVSFAAPEQNSTEPRRVETAPPWQKLSSVVVRPTAPRAPGALRLRMA